MDEGKEGHEAMLPNEEDVIYEPFPQESKEVVCIDMELLKSMCVSNCIVWGSSGAMVVPPGWRKCLPQKVKLSAMEDKFEEFDEGGVDRVLGSRSYGFQSFKCCLDSLGVGYICIEAA